MANGARFLLETEVTGINTKGGRVVGAKTTAGEIEADYIINAAGLHCDDIAAMVGKNDYYVNPRKGQFYILDKNTSCKVNHIVLPIPTKLTKGKLMTPTMHGNMLVGPTAENLTDKFDKSTNAEGLASICEDVSKLIPNVVFRDTITQYSGLRANRNPEGLHIPLMLSYTIVDIKGNDRVEGVVVTEVDDKKQPIPGTEQLFECDTLLLSVGLIPENEITRKAGIEINRITNGPIVNQFMQTGLESVFACGNVVHVNDLVDNVSTESAIAGASAAKYAAGTLGGGDEITVVTGENVRYVCPQKVSPNILGTGVDIVATGNVK